MTEGHRTASPAHQVAQRLLAATGRTHSIDPDLPPAYVIGELWRRAVQLLRGLVILRRVVFLGKGVKVRGKRGLTLASGVSIGEGTIIDARGVRGVRIGSGSRLGRRGVVTAVSRLSLRGQGVQIGENSGIGDDFHLGASGGITVGDNVIVGPGLYVHSQTHNFSDPSVLIRLQGTKEDPVHVSDDCWIGSRVTLLAGTRLGPRTVVASGAVVMGTHPGHQVLAGVPARKVKDLE